MGSAAVTVHPLTHDSHAAWNRLKTNQTVRIATTLALDEPIRADAVRFVCISDTHSAIERMRHPIPDGDVLIHAGDFTRKGFTEEVDAFSTFLGTLPHRHKVVIAGNHELSFDPVTAARSAGVSNEAVERVKRRLVNCTYLQDAATTVCGVKVYGSPWQPRFHNWAFNLQRGQALLDKWNRIPTDTDVLVTHTPPVGHGDHCVLNRHVGCVELLSVVQHRVRPRYHVFGHIHEGYGVTTDGETVFVNAAICDVQYRPVNAPIIFDMPLPEGASKDR
uniref:Calcineurin-like phosphoesterase domain-containing protein n=1 Tax=Amblyomma maculatum TaxID=34609 RepID=G3MPS1_AMBMU